jgi:hypothetical protein
MDYGLFACTVPIKPCLEVGFGVGCRKSELSLKIFVPLKYKNIV